MIIFLDETGQFTKNDHEKYFLIGSFTTGDPRRTEKRFRSWQHDHFPRKMRHLTEVKFSNPDIDEKLRLKTLKEIAVLDVRIRYSFIKRQNIPLQFRYKGVVKTGHLYAEIVFKTLERYLPITDKEFRVFCDQRHLKGLKRSEFKSLLASRLLPKLPQKPIIQIEMINSASNANIQIADWISGALGWYYNEKELGKECWEILRNNLLDQGEELFKNYWRSNVL